MRSRTDPNTRATIGTSPRQRPVLALAWCVAGLAAAAALLPAWAQTAAGTDKAQERSQQQSDNVYRWIKYFADQPKKLDPNKTRPKTDTPQVAKKPEVKAPAEPAQTATDTTAVPSAVAPEANAQQQPSPPTVAAAPPVAPPEPVVAAETLQPLKPIHVVEPVIPRGLRDEVINTTVLLSFTVQSDGTVAAPAVITGDNRRLNRSALEAIAQWRFEPVQTARSTQIEFAFRQE